ncbi:hypothetical protein SRHO_G00028990 [Serrasalmus rhombeus]
MRGVLLDGLAVAGILPAEASSSDLGNADTVVSGEKPVALGEASANIPVMGEDPVSYLLIGQSLETLRLAIRLKELELDTKREEHEIQLLRTRQCELEYGHACRVNALPSTPQAPVNVVPTSPMLVLDAPSLFPEVQPSLPVEGVDFILGNDLAGGKVLPLPEVIDDAMSELQGSQQVADVASEFPSVFPACVVTRAQSCEFADTVDLIVSCILMMAPMFLQKIPLFPVRCSLKPCPQFVELNQNCCCLLRENKLLRISKMIHPWFAADNLR